MIDLTRDEIEEIARNYDDEAILLSTSKRPITGSAITQLLRQLDAADKKINDLREGETRLSLLLNDCARDANARADAAAGQMRERCAQEAQMFIEGFAFDEEWQLDDMQAAIRALPLHEEPNK